MEIEHVSKEEYEEYIARLKKKNVNEMGYDELTDLANDAHDEGNYKMAWRLLLLALDVVWVKADTTGIFLKKVLRGEIPIPSKAQEPEGNKRENVQEK